MAMPRVQVVLGGERVPQSLQGALLRVGASASFEPLTQAVRSGPDASADAVVVVDDVTARPESLSILLHRLAEKPHATLVMERDGGPRLGTFPAAAPICFGAALSEDELTARLSTLIDLHVPLRTLAARRRADEQAAERVAEAHHSQLRLAAQMQRELLPATVPSFGPWRFAVLYRPAGEISGDVCTVRALDEDYVAFGLADAAGCGVSAALLTVLVKRGLRGRELVQGRQRVLSPDEVLAQLNVELIEAELSECHFVAAVYGLLNRRTGAVLLARAGTPYPLLRQRDGLVRVLGVGGCVLGVDPDVEFPVEIAQLAPGDSLILSTDGVESVFHRAGGAAAAAGASGRTPATLDEWTAQLATDGLSAAVETVGARHELLRRLGRPMDDLTLLSLEYNPSLAD